MKQLAPLDYCRETLELKKNIEESFLVLGERLTRIKDEQLYKGSWESFSEYCAEAQITDATASKLITVFRTFVQNYGVDREKLVKASWSNLYELIPLIEDKKTATEFVDKAVTLRREDLREEIREAKKGKHEHTWVEERFRRCTVCNKLEKI